MTELSTLERKPLSDLHQIASQLGIEQYRKYRKPQLAELIYKTATEQAVGQQAAETTANGGETATPTLTPENGTNGNGETAPVAHEITEARPDPFGEAAKGIAGPAARASRRPQPRAPAHAQVPAGRPTRPSRPRKKSSSAVSSSGAETKAPTDSLSSAGTGAGPNARARVDARRKAGA